MSHNIYSFLLRISVLVCAAMLITACINGRTTTVDRVDRDADIPNAPYSSILVVGVAPTAENGRRFESALVAKITNKSTTAIAHHVERPDGVVSEAAIRELVERKRVDAVMITSVKDAKVDTKVNVDQVQLERTRRNKTLVDFFRYDYKDIVAAPTMKLAYSVVLVTEVFDVRTGQKVYSLESSTQKAERGEDIIVAESTVIARQLRRDAIVR